MRQLAQWLLICVAWLFVIGFLLPVMYVLAFEDPPRDDEGDL